MQHRNPLVIYYSRSGKTAAAARAFADTLDGTLVPIQDMTDRAGIRGFWRGVIDVKRDRPTRIQPLTIPTDQASLLVIGSPIWGMRLAPAIATLLPTLHLEAKRVVLLLTVSGHVRTSALRPVHSLIAAAGGEVIDTVVIKSMCKNASRVYAAAAAGAHTHAARWQ